MLSSGFAPSGDAANYHTHAEAQDFNAERVEDPSANADRVTHFRLCPRRLLLYVGEAYTLVPVPLDRNKEIVHGVATRWETSDPSIATVSSWGEVSAVAPGHLIVRAQAGTGRATISVEVREGARRRLSDLEFDLEHSRDCDDPEANDSDGSQADLTTNQPNVSKDDWSVSGNASTNNLALVGRGNVRRSSNDDGEVGAGLATNKSIDASDRAAADSLPKLARPAVLRTSSTEVRKSVPASFRGSSTRAAVRTVAATKKIFGRGFFYISDPIDGSSGDAFSPAATAPYNAVGSPRFAPQEDSNVGAAKTKNALGSYNYQFTAPVLSLGGRGIGTELGLVYNSRLWEKDAGSMTFNYNKGWPAAGWSIGYGRIIQNYDNTGTGDQSGLWLGERTGELSIAAGGWQPNTSSAVLRFAVR